MRNLVYKLAQDGKVHIRVGLTANVYAFALHKHLIDTVAKVIDKSTASVYFNGRLKVWAIRCKSKHHKQRLLEYKAVNRIE